jgi:hypothetical protein
MGRELMGRDDGGNVIIYNIGLIGIFTMNPLLIMNIF